MAGNSGEPESGSSGYVLGAVQFMSLANARHQPPCASTVGCMPLLALRAFCSYGRSTW
jgi:hypothetical protein